MASQLLSGIAACTLFLTSTQLLAKETPTEVAPDPAEAELLTFGEIEFIWVNAANAEFEARIDTGATTSSIDADEVTPFERDGEKWVRFTTPHPNAEKPAIVLERPVARVVRIKESGGRYNRRFVVVLEVTINTRIQKAQFTLADRDNYDFPVLVGRNILNGFAIVDVSKKHVQGSARAVKKGKAITDSE